MTSLPPTIIIFDTEFTAWAGSQERDFSGPNEYRELVEIGAIKIDTRTFNELETLVLYIKPVKNPLLSDYFIALTKITQNTIDQKGVSCRRALKKFRKFIGNNHCYSYGNDLDIIKENCQLNNAPYFFDDLMFHNICDYFRERGIKTENYHSGNITEAFGVASRWTDHDALNDCRDLVDGLRLTHISKH